MRRLRAVHRRREAQRALARADLPEPVRSHLSTPQPPSPLPWREATYTVLDLETTGLDPARDVIVAAGGLRVVDGRAAAATGFRLLVRPTGTCRPRPSASTACYPGSSRLRRRSPSS